MYGNWRHNLIIGLVGSVLVFIFALMNNPITITLLRTCYGFIMFFLIAYAIRFVLGTFVFTSEKETELATENSEEHSGQNIDYMAECNDENLNDLLKQQLAKNAPSSRKGQDVQHSEEQVEDEAFKPLKPTQLFSSKGIQTEEMSKAIRHLTGE